MKAKKIKKELKKLQRTISNQYPVKGCEKKEDFGNDYNEEVSNKFKKIIKSIVEFDNFNINMRSDSINIYINDIKNIKKASQIYVNNTNCANNSNNSNYLEIYIIKDVGFRISYKDDSLSFVDTNIYSEVFEDIKEKFHKISCQKFHNIYDDFIKESGLLRDNNLEEILNG